MKPSILHSYPDPRRSSRSRTVGPRRLSFDAPFAWQPAAHDEHRRNDLSDNNDMWRGHGWFGWAINRAVGQIYAMLFIADRLLNADDLVGMLGLSRGGVSMGLKELQSWSLVQLRHLPNDRRDHFTTPDDVWAIMRTLVEERKKRGIDPTLTTLRDLLMTTPQSDSDAYAQARLAAMHDQIELLTTWYVDIQTRETERLIQLLSLGTSIAKVLELKDKFFVLPGGRKEVAS